MTDIILNFLESQDWWVWVAAAISAARINRLYFGAFDKKSGAVFSGVKLYDAKNCHHVPEVYAGICEYESLKLMQEFFKEKFHSDLCYVYYSNLMQVYDNIK